MILVFDDDIYDKKNQFPFLNYIDAIVFDRADMCLDQIREYNPSLVLMDYQMRSHYFGGDAIRDIRKIYSKEQLNILAISSSADCNKEMIRVGANDFVLKKELNIFMLQKIKSKAI